MLTLLPLDKRWELTPKCCDKHIQGFPSLGSLRTQGGSGDGATELHSFQPGGFSSLVHSSVRILNIRRWMQRLRWSGRTRRSRTQKRLKLRYHNTKEHHPILTCYQEPLLSGLMFQWKHLSEQNAVETVKKVQTIEIEDKLKAQTFSGKLTK